MITTIIANYNYGSYVVEAIHSALNQTVKNKIVVVDDGSTDDSVSKIKENFSFWSCHNELLYGNDIMVYDYDQLTLIQSKNNGASTARNLGMKLSWKDTEFFCILDADDSILPDKYEKFLKIMEDDAVGVVYGDYVIRRPGYTKYEYKQPYSIQALSEQCIVHSGSMIRKSYLEKVLLSTGEVYDKNLHGPASKGFIGCTEDYDLWLRLSKVCMMVHVPEILSIVNEHGNNQSMKMTQQIFNQNSQTIKARK
jgi:glycosyltransferase involved in cell wall biosynthesis